MIYIFLISFLVSVIPPLEGTNIKLVYSYSVEENIEEGVYFGNIRDAVFTIDGRIIVLPSSEQTVFVFNKAEFIRSLGHEGRGPGELQMPMSVSSNKNGDILVSDLGNAKIAVWDKGYNLINELSPPSNALVYAHTRSFQSNATDLFYWTMSPNPSIGFDNIRIHRFDSDFENIELYFSINDGSEEEIHKFVSGWGTWDVSDEGDIIMAGKTPDYRLYKFDIKEERFESFGNPVKPVVRTKIENEQRLENARRVSTQAASMLSNASDEKPVFQNLEIDSKGLIWAHRSKVYGAVEEIDIYSLDGNFITTITLPSSKDEYRLMDIFNEKALFRVTHEDGRHSLRVYEINYNS